MVDVCIFYSDPDKPIVEILSAVITKLESKWGQIYFLDKQTQSRCREDYFCGQTKNFSPVCFA